MYDDWFNLWMFLSFTGCLGWACAAGGFVLGWHRCERESAYRDALDLGPRERVGGGDDDALQRRDDDAEGRRR